VTAETYPRLRNVSVGFMFKRLARALKPALPEYVTLPLERRGSFSDGYMFAVAKWNLLWESAQFRRRYFDEDELPPEVGEIADRGDVNVAFVPRTATRYYEYAPLYHLLSRSQAQRHGLPLISTGIWPYVASYSHPDRYLPTDFGARLSRAWASAVWRHLSPGSPLSAFTRSDPIRLLAHNLDFWVPPVTAVMEEILRGVDGAGNAANTWFCLARGISHESCRVDRNARARPATLRSRVTCSGCARPAPRSSCTISR
jgi:hypothetical protein